MNEMPGGVMGQGGMRSMKVSVESETRDNKACWMSR